jgi:hypothetical protein
VGPRHADPGAGHGVRAGRRAARGSSSGLPPIATRASTTTSCGRCST